MKAVEAIFAGGVLRPTEPLELEEGARVLMHIEVIDAPFPARPADSDRPREPVLFDAVRTTFKVISDEDDLTKVAVNYWPKDAKDMDARGAKVGIHRTVRRLPNRPPPADESDLLIMDDDLP